MMFRVGFMLASFFLLLGCAHKTTVQIPSPPQRVQLSRQVSDFTRIDARGTLDVTLHTTGAHAKVVLKGDSRDVGAVVTNVVHGVLVVTVADGFPRFGSLQMDVSMPHLYGLTYQGMGRVTGQNIQSRWLDLKINTKGLVKLQGQMGLRKLEVKGGGNTEIAGINGPRLQLMLSGKSVVRLSGVVNLTHLDMKSACRLSIYWVKSQDLTIRGRGGAWIQLAGAVDKLDLELWDKAHFNGRYLRIDRAFVKTHDKSVAELSSVLRQHTLALDKSDIYFYNIPAMKTDFMAKAGAVLDMRNMASPFIQEYDEYNK